MNKKEPSLKGYPWYMAPDGKRAVVDCHLGFMCYEGALVEDRFTGTYCGLLNTKVQVFNFLTGESNKRPVRLVIPEVYNTFSEALPKPEQPAEKKLDDWMKDLTKEKKND